MDPRYSAPIASFLVLAVGMAATTVWLSTDTTADLTARLPADDGRAPVDEASYVRPEPVLTTGDGTPSTIEGAWPCFRGERLDAIATGGPKLAREWPAEGPPVLWSVDLGEGYAGAAIRDGRVYIMDYDQENKADALRCLSLDDGREIWRHTYPLDVKRNHGMSRTIPSVTEDVCVAIGPMCHVSGVDPETGELLWLLDMVHDFGTVVPEWYAGQCPLIDDGRLILAPSGPDVFMAAIDARTGEEIWRTPNPMGWLMTHTSVVPMTIGDRKTYVYSASDGVAGADAETGELLWTTDEWKVRVAACASPLVLPGDRLFFCGGYNAGAMLMDITTTDDGRFEPVVVRPMPREEFGSTQQTPILRDGYIYGIRERDGLFVCMDQNGDEVWATDRSEKFGDGAYIFADDLLFIVDDDGTLTMAEATPQGYKRLARFNPLDGHDAWGPPAIVDGRMLVRDLVHMVCLDLREER